MSALTEEHIDAALTFLGAILQELRRIADALSRIVDYADKVPF